jgi:hypothetical protein
VTDTQIVQCPVEGCTYRTELKLGSGHAGGLSVIGTHLAKIRNEHPNHPPSMVPPAPAGK